MKQVIILLVFSCFAFTASAQNAQTLIEQGIKLFDAGRYEEALKKYKQALAIDKTSSEANYEIASTYVALGDYKSGMKYSKKVLDANPEVAILGYMVYGTCLDELGKSAKAIAAYEEGLKKFGPHYLLYYNLGLTAYRQNQYEKAEGALKSAVQNNPNHPSSHLLLGLVNFDRNLKSKTLLCLFHFLMLEPKGERAELAYGLVKDLLVKKAEKGASNAYTINVSLSKDKDGFASSDLMISMFSATNIIEKNQDQSETERFNSNADIFLGMLNNTDGNKGFWWDYYAPLFVKLKADGQFDAFSNYISQSKEKSAVKWMKENADATEQFKTWMYNNIK